MKMIIKIVRGVVIALLCLLLALNLWLIAARVFLHQDLPKVFGFSQAVVMSGSMEPLFSAGDVVVFQEQDSYAVGDVVIFRRDGVFITHRIAGQQEDHFITKGDANNTEDQQLLAPEYIEGRLVLIIPGIGAVMNFLRSPLGILLIVVVGLLLVELPEIWGRHKGRRGKENE